jgi:hypothetical protein
MAESLRKLVSLGAVATLWVMPACVTLKASSEVTARFVAWTDSRESANYPIAQLEFHNLTSNPCVVKRYALYWPRGSRELTPRDLTIAAGSTVTRTVSFEGESVDRSDPAVVQVWDTTCGKPR